MNDHHHHHPDDNHHVDDHVDVPTSRECHPDTRVCNRSSTRGSCASSSSASSPLPCSHPSSASSSVSSPTEQLLPAVAATALLSTLLGMAISRYLLSSSSHSSSSRRRRRRAGSRSRARRKGRRGKRRGQSPSPAHSSSRRRSRSRSSDGPSDTADDDETHRGHERESSETTRPPLSASLPRNNVLEEGGLRPTSRRRIQRQPQQRQQRQLEFEHDLSELTVEEEDEVAAKVQMVMRTEICDTATDHRDAEKKGHDEDPRHPLDILHSHSHFDAARLPPPPLTPSTLHTTVTPSCLSSMMTPSSPSRHPSPPTLPPPPSSSSLQPRRPSKISFVAMDPSSGGGNDNSRNVGNHHIHIHNHNNHDDALLAGGGAATTTTTMRPFRSSFRRSSALRDSMLDSIRDSVRDSLTDDDDGSDDGDNDDEESNETRNESENDTPPLHDGNGRMFDEPPQRNGDSNNDADPDLDPDLDADRKPTSESAPEPHRPPSSRHPQNRHCHLGKRNSWSSGLHSLSHRRSHHSPHHPHHPHHPDVLFDGEDEFESLVLSPLKTMHEARRLLRRTRAISALANRLMAAKDEATCIDEVTRLMAIMFTVDRVSFGFLTGDEHFTLKRITIKRRHDQEEETEQTMVEETKEDDTSETCDTPTHKQRQRQHPPPPPRRWQSSFDLEYLESDLQRPLAGTAAGVCAKTLQEHYTPRTADSHFHTHKVFYEQGLNTVLATPILVNGNKCTGVILLSKQEEDAFPTSDRILIRDIATLLGANIYAKRLRKQTEESNRLSREMLHSFVPPKVLEKIEGYWDEKSEKYRQNPNKTGSSTSCSSSTENSVSGTASADADGGAQDPMEHLSLSSSSPRGGGGKVQLHHPHPAGADPDDNDIDNAAPASAGRERGIARSNSWYVANTDWTEAALENDMQQRHQLRGRKREIESRIRLMRNMEGRSAENVGVIVSTEGMELAPTSRALYAENVRNVCIIFTDIVGFSKISLELSPIKVMNMLQDLFNRFDNLCDVHGVMKLETIGDAYLCATNLLEDDDGDEDVVRDAAVRALGMAKDMICEARNVIIPYHDKSGRRFDDCTLQIRVGIHVGDITCGVLGQRVPKFTTCGTAVNMAARMEQTSKPSMIRATQDFHDLVGDAERNWSEKQSISLKNMGTVETYLLDPINSSNNDVFGGCGRSRSMSDSFLSFQCD